MAEANGARAVGLTAQSLAILLPIGVVIGGVSWSLAWAISSHKARPVIIADEASQALIQALDGRYQRMDVANVQYDALRMELARLRQEMEALRTEVRSAK